MRVLLLGKSWTINHFTTWGSLVKDHDIWAPYELLNSIKKKIKKMFKLHNNHTDLNFDKVNSHHNPYTKIWPNYQILMKHNYQILTGMQEH